ncbi:MAG: cysteine rich repeat-containing protein, partial [Pseudomonadota bacterium]
QAARPAVEAPRLSFGQELRVAARACLTDFRRFCPDLPIGHGNVARCLRTHSADLQPACSEALSTAAALR